MARLVQSAVSRVPSLIPTRFSRDSCSRLRFPSQVHCDWVQSRHAAIAQTWPSEGPRAIPRRLLRFCSLGLDARPRCALIFHLVFVKRCLPNRFGTAFASARWDAKATLQSQLWAASTDIPISSLVPKPWGELSFREKHGTWIFFLAQPIAIALESVYLSGKKRRIGGLAGRVWTMAWVAGLGAWAVGRSWLALGIAHGVPSLHHWSLARFVLPTAHLCPAPLFMNV